MTNLPAVQLSTLTSEITALTERLAPVQEDAVVRSLAVMQAAGMVIPKGIDPDKMLSIYRYALDGAPSCGLTIATQKLIKGDYAGNPEILLGMVPKPPVLAALAKIEARTVREDLSRKRDALATLAPPRVEYDKSAEVMARVRAKRIDVVSKLQSPPPAVEMDPISEERAAYLAAILALPDAKTTSQEQRAFRRQLEAELEIAAPAEPERSVA